VQPGLPGVTILRITLQRPLLHLAYLAVVMTVVMLGGWGL